jgi:hypothetical protein
MLVGVSRQLPEGIPMGVESIKHRTGRPKGSKTTPRWVRALNWAERNYGTPGAVPPNALAARLLELARERPELFVRCLALRDAPQREARPPKAPAAPANGTPPAGAAVGPASRASDPWLRYPNGLKVLVFLCRNMWDMFDGEAKPVNLPPDGQVVDCWPQGGGVALLFHAPSLPRLGPGRPVPVEDARFQYEEIITVNGRRI